MVIGLAAHILLPGSLSPWRFRMQAAGWTRRVFVPALQRLWHPSGEHQCWRECLPAAAGVQGLRLYRDIIYCYLLGVIASAICKVGEAVCGA